MQATRASDRNGEVVESPFWKAPSFHSRLSTRFRWILPRPRQGSGRTTCSCGAATSTAPTIGTFARSPNFCRWRRARTAPYLSSYEGGRIHRDHRRRSPSRCGRDRGVDGDCWVVIFDRTAIDLCSMYWREEVGDSVGGEWWGVLRQFMHVQSFPVCLIDDIPLANI